MASTNIFDLLNDDAQDQTIQVPVVKKEVKPVAVKASAAPSKPVDNKAPRKEGARNNKPRDGDAPRGPRYDRAPRDGDAPRAPRGAPRAPRGASRGGRHGGLDRHSGTGLENSDKKEHRIAGDATTAPLQGEKDAEVAVEAAVVEAAEPAIPEPVVKTLEDYLAEKAAKSLKIALPEARSANAGADDSQWKNAKVLEVEETGDFIKMRADSIAKAKKGKKEAKVLIKDIEVRYTEPAREPVAPRGGARGGRGGERGARGGAPRGGAAPRRGAAPRNAVNVNVDDTNLFPSLGSK